MDGTNEKDSLDQYKLKNRFRGDLTYEKYKKKCLVNFILKVIG